MSERSLRELLKTILNCIDEICDFTKGMAMKISLLTLRLSMHSLENSYRTLGSAKKFSH